MSAGDVAAAPSGKRNGPDLVALRSPLRGFRTRNQLEQDLRGLIAQAKALVRGSLIVYLDTADILLRAPISKRAIDEIAKRCGSIQVTGSKAYPGGYPFRLTLQQPLDPALQLIEENLDHIVSRFDVAFDLPTKTTADAAELAAIVQAIAYQPWHGRRKSRVVKGETSYAGERGSARNISIYGTRPSKVTGGHCCHIELRYVGAPSCGKRGVRTCHDLLAYDPMVYLNRDIKLGLIEWNKAFGVLRQLADLELRTRRRVRASSATRRKLTAYPGLVRLTFERLITPDHRPSFADPPIVNTQRALDCVRAWSGAVVSLRGSVLFEGDWDREGIWE